MGAVLLSSIGINCHVQGSWDIPPKPILDASMCAAYWEATWEYTAEEDRSMRQHEVNQNIQKRKQPSSTKPSQPVDILKMDWSSAIAGHKPPAKQQPSKSAARKAATMASPGRSSAELASGSQHSSKEAGPSAAVKVASNVDAGSSPASVTAAAASATGLAATGIDHVPVAGRAAAQDSGGCQITKKAASL